MIPRLHTVRQAASEIADEYPGVSDIPVADVPREDQLRVGVNCRPRPNAPDSRLVAHGGGKVAILRIAEGPDLIALHLLRCDLPDRAIVEGEARRANILEEFQDCHLRNARHAASRVDRVAFD